MYTLTHLNSAASAAATVESMSYYSGYLEDVNRIIGAATTGKVILMLMPEQVTISRNNWDVWRVTFWYFKRHTIAVGKTDIEMASDMRDEFQFFLDELTTDDTIVNLGNEYVLKDFIPFNDKDKMACMSCTMNIKVFNCPPKRGIGVYIIGSTFIIS